MPVEVVMPKLGLTMESGTIARWIKQPGEAVREGEPLVEVSTDKINYEVESPASGTMARTLGSDGDEFACGDVIGLIALAGESDTPNPARASASDALESPAAFVEAPLLPPAASGVIPTAPVHLANGARSIASPAARRLARERGIPLSELHGTGPRGRVTLADVESHQPRITRPRQPERGVPTALPPPQLPASRRAIFRKMTDVAQLPLAQVETIANVDAIKALIDRRADFGWTAYAVYAVARLLHNHPDLRTDATTGAPFKQIDIGVAADTPHGLIVPVVRNADTRTLAETQNEILRLANLAREGTLTGTDIGGACFSISNVGPQRIDRVAPLPDPPQTAILGIGAATQRPTVINGALTPAWMLTCVLTFDHRFIDGAPAARFLASLAHAFADPGALL